MISAIICILLKFVKLYNLGLSVEAFCSITSIYFPALICSFAVVSLLDIYNTRTLPSLSEKTEQRATKYRVYKKPLKWKH